MALTKSIRSAWSRVAGRTGSVVLGLALLAVNLVLVNYLAGRHHTRSDWTSSKVYSLSAKTVELLRSLKRPVRITSFMVPPQRHEQSLFHEVQELLRRIRRHSQLVTVEHVDIDLDPTRADLLAKKHAVSAAQLREGVVVVHSGGRQKNIPALAMGEYEARGPRRKLVAFLGESALLEALIAVTTTAPLTVCFTSGHGEARTDSYVDAGYGFIVDEVRRDAFKVRVVGSRDLLAGARGCSVLVIGGPRLAFAQVELDAIDRFLRHDGRVFVLLGPVLDRRVTRHRKIALEALLSRWGARVLDKIVVDRLAVPGEQPLMTWATRDGYGDHPISRSVAGKVTVWPLVREVRPDPSARKGLEVAVLVRTSAQGWAETDLASLRGDRPLELDREVDSPGPVSVAVAARWRRSRLVVFGTERGVLNRRLGGVTVRDYNRDLFMAALNWLAGQEGRVAIGPKTPEHVQLTLDDGQLGRVFLISVVAMPLCALFGGVVVWWRRRR